jgi:DNA-3-methyladenine glycosylase I
MINNKENIIRCPWCLKDELYTKYHDEEWGIPVHDDKKHFEFLILETFQAGLSWHTILKKRENFRKAFDGFDVIKVSKYNEKKIDLLLQDSGIIRYRLKIESAIANAKAFISTQEEFGTFDKYIWSFVNNKQIKNKLKSMSEIPTKTELSDKVSIDMKKRGFKFVGSTTIYAHLQAIGVVDDHLVNCYRY